jgi:hypothetical protein
MAARQGKRQPVRAGTRTAVRAGTRAAATPRPAPVRAAQRAQKLQSAAAELRALRATAAQAQNAIEKARVDRLIKQQAENMVRLLKDKRRAMLSRPRLATQIAPLPAISGPRAAAASLRELTPAFTTKFVQALVLKVPRRAGELDQDYANRLYAYTQRGLLRYVKHRENKMSVDRALSAALATVLANDVPAIDAQPYPAVNVADSEARAIWERMIPAGPAINELIVDLQPDVPAAVSVEEADLDQLVLEAETQTAALQTEAAAATADATSTDILATTSEEVLEEPKPSKFVWYGLGAAALLAAGGLYWYTRSR